MKITWAKLHQAVPNRPRRGWGWNEEWAVVRVHAGAASPAGWARVWRAGPAAV